MLNDMSLRAVSPHSAAMYPRRITRPLGSSRGFTGPSTSESAGSSATPMKRPERVMKSRAHWLS